MAIVTRAKRWHYLSLPYGPVFVSQSHLQDDWNPRWFESMTTQLIHVGRELSVDFIRSAPFLSDTPTHRQLYQNLGWKPAPIHMLAEHIWWLDITPSADQLLAGMRKTMRNLIKRASKDGVTIRLSQDPADVEIFIDIHRDTVKRHHFIPYSNSYFRQQFSAFGPQQQATMFIAEYQSKPIAAAMIMFYGDTASYHHGASLSAYNKIPATYLLQWTAIQEAQRRGCRRYNFWGIVPDHKLVSPLTKKPHPFAGVTKFKTGFGGELLNLLPCHDYPLTSRYQLTRIIETVRKYRRGFF